jgi:hypothetical protein
VIASTIEMPIASTEREQLETTTRAVRALANRKNPLERGFHEMGGTGLEPVTPSLSSWC